MSRTADQDDYVVLYDVPPAMYAKLLDALGNVRTRHSYSDRTLEIRRVLHGIGPDQYREILEALGDHSLRHTYDGWDLEMMSPRQEHEWIKRLIGRMIEGYVNAQSIPIKSISSTTLRAPGYAQGVQPDECYFIQSELAVRGKDSYDPAVDPPPDLVIEVDLTSNCIERMPLFAALGVPEIWRHDQGRMHFYRLGPRDEYIKAESSAAFPAITSADLTRFLSQRNAIDETSLVQAFVRHAGRE